MPTGKVAVFTASGVPFEIEELPTPEVEPGWNSYQEHARCDLWF